MYNEEVEQKLFSDVIGYFQRKYPHRNITVRRESYGLMINIDGEDRFNATGYNLLYNLKRLCDALESELR